MGDAGNPGGLKKERGNVRRERRTDVRKGRDIYMAVGQGSETSDICLVRGQSLRKGTRCLTFHTLIYMAHVHH